MSDQPEDEQDERDSFTEVREQYAERLKERIAAGDTLTSQELSFLEAVKAEDADDIPKSLNVAKIKYPRSPAQIKQSRENLARINSEKLQTGPTTPGGKSTSSKNAIKHGLYAQSLLSLFKPCFTTCPEYPCALVEEGRTAAGDNCLDKQHFVEIVDAVEKAMKHKQFDDLNDLLSLELAANWDMIRKLREHLLVTGSTVKSIKKITTTGKDGGSITTEHEEYKLHPVLLALPQLIDKFGLTLPAAMLTPREIAKNKVDEDGVQAAANIFNKAGRVLQSAPPEEEKE